MKGTKHDFENVIFYTHRYTISDFLVAEFNVTFLITLRGNITVRVSTRLYCLCLKGYKFSSDRAFSSGPSCNDRNCRLI